VHTAQPKRKRNKITQAERYEYIHRHIYATRGWLTGSKMYMDFLIHWFLFIFKYKKNNKHSIRILKVLLEVEKN
jgi:hypothetical protein